MWRLDFGTFRVVRTRLWATHFVQREFVVYMPIIERVLQNLSTNEPQSIPQILSALPELANTAQAEQVLCLLLRLDRRVRLMADGRWSTALTSNTPEQRVITTAQSYLSTIPSGGALLTSIVEHVAKNTDYEPAVVSSIILRRFVNNGRSVLNQLK